MTSCPAALSRCAARLESTPPLSSSATRSGAAPGSHLQQQQQCRGVGGDCESLRAVAGGSRSEGRGDAEAAAIPPTPSTRRTLAAALGGCATLKMAAAAPGALRGAPGQGAQAALARHPAAGRQRHRRLTPPTPQPPPPPPPARQPWYGGTSCMTWHAVEGVLAGMRRRGQGSKTFAGLLAAAFSLWLEAN